ILLAGGSLNHNGRHRTVDKIDVVSFRLVLGKHSAHQVLGVAAVKVNLDERILFLERLLHWTHHLIDDQMVYHIIFPSFFAPSMRIFCRSADFIIATSSTDAATDCRGPVKAATVTVKATAATQIDKGLPLSVIPISP